ncbi:hypothetical protein [Demequina sediminicola]|uniref:hypothetical protein n=1 Tax=Demequina sediminicola TaxID=1095026 RepID=UPI0007847FCB|nr:hypothetical protein [Demequina sediminicola]
MSDRERGSVTAEFALALPVMVVVVGLVLTTLSWAGEHLQAKDLAALAARTAAVEGDEAGRSVVAGVSADAGVSISRVSPWIHATVTLPGNAWLPDIAATSTARVQG